MTIAERTDDIEQVVNYPRSDEKSPVILVIGNTAHEAAEWARKYLGKAHYWQAVDADYPVEGTRSIATFILDGTDVVVDTFLKARRNDAMSAPNARPSHCRAV